MTTQIAGSGITTPNVQATQGVGGTPAFKAKSNGTQNVTSSVFTKVILATEVFDTNNCFDSGANSRFQPNVAGYYQLDYVMDVNASAGTLVSAFAKLYKNGIADTVGSGIFGGNTLVTQIVCSGSTITYLNGTTDYVELFGYAAGTSPNFGASSSFSGFLARAA